LIYNKLHLGKKYLKKSKNLIEINAFFGKKIKFKDQKTVRIKRIIYIIAAGFRTLPRFAWVNPGTNCQTIPHYENTFFNN